LGCRVAEKSIRGLRFVPLCGMKFDVYSLRFVPLCGMRLPLHKTGCGEETSNLKLVFQPSPFTFAAQ
jgi:hypothetical protein